MHVYTYFFGYGPFDILRQFTNFSDHEYDIDLIKTEPESDDEINSVIKLENIENGNLANSSSTTENDEEETGENDDDENERSSRRNTPSPAVTRRSPRIRENSVLREKQATNSNGKKVASNGSEVEWVEEPSYFFKLSKSTDALYQFSPP